MRLLFATLLIMALISCKSEHKTTIKPSIEDQNQLAKSSVEGQLVYNNFCVSCHLDHGKGVPKVFPPLDNSDYLKQNQIKSIKAIKYGMSGEIKVNGVTYNSAMAPLGLSDKEIADVMNYINNSWSNTIETLVTEDDVSKL